MVKNMKQVKSFFLAFIFILLGMQSLSAQASKDRASENNRQVTFEVTGMTCGGCASHVHQALEKEKGVLENEVKYPGNIATVTYSPSITDEKKIIAAIEKTGYTAAVLKEDESQNRSQK